MAYLYLPFVSEFLTVCQFYTRQRQRPPITFVFNCCGMNGRPPPKNTNSEAHNMICELYRVKKVDNMKCLSALDIFRSVFPFKHLVARESMPF